MEKQEHPPGTPPLWRCPQCGRLHTLDDKNILVLSDPKSEPAEAEAVTTHTAAILNPTPVNPETMEQAVAIAEKSLKRKDKKPVEVMPALETPPLKRGALAKSLYPEVARRLASGERPCVIARDIGYEPQSVNNFKTWHKKEIEAAANSAPKEGPNTNIKINIEPAAADPKPNGHKYKEFNYACKKGNIISQMGRLRRGVIKPQQARGVLISYKQVLEFELRREQGVVKDIKHKLAATDEALRQLDIVLQGEKAAVDNLFAVVGNGRKG